MNKILGLAIKFDGAIKGVGDWNEKQDITNAIVYYGKWFVDTIAFVAFVILTIFTIQSAIKSGKPTLSEDQQADHRSKALVTGMMAVISLIIAIVIFVFAKDLGVSNVQKL